MEIREIIRIMTQAYKDTDEVAMGYWMDAGRVKYLCEKYNVKLTDDQIQIVIAACHSKMCDHRRDIEDMIDVKRMIQTFCGVR